MANLDEALKRAALLMGAEGDARINKFSSQARKNKVTESKEIPAMPTRLTSIPSRNELPITEGMRANSKLPQAILDSMMNNPINAGNTTGNVSVLDSLNINIPQKPAQVINETATIYEAAPQQTYAQPQQVAPVYQAPPMMVDYNYIRAIVNECIQANMQKIKEEILNESALKAIRMGDGNKIQLIDNKNNLYESVLSFKKNISKK